jgi:hypothetical protein
MTELGQPGEPGQPGAPGERGGGEGGHGGAGGRGGHAGVSHNGKLIGLLVFVLVVAVGLSIATFIQTSHIDANADAIAALERKDAMQQRQVGVALTLANERQDQQIVNARKAEYRICVRQMVNRAAIDLDKGGDEVGLPLYDCTPNLTGEPARLLTPAQRAAFEHYVRTTPEDKLP